MASDYKSKHKVKNKDSRRIIFKKQLELLRILGDEFYQKGKQDIEEILEKHPYDDGLYERVIKESK